MARHRSSYLHYTGQEETLFNSITLWNFGVKTNCNFFKGFLYSVANAASKTAMKVKDTVKETVEGKVSMDFVLSLVT